MSPRARPISSSAAPISICSSNDLEHLRRRISTVPTSPNFRSSRTSARRASPTISRSSRASRKNWRQGMLGSWSTDNEAGFSDDRYRRARCASRTIWRSRRAWRCWASSPATCSPPISAAARASACCRARSSAATARRSVPLSSWPICETRPRSPSAMGRQVYHRYAQPVLRRDRRALRRDGAEILSFLGDGFLAVFPCARHRGPSEIACRAALTTARNAVSRMALLNLQRRQQNLSEIGFGIGLHVGNVMFGNVGSSDRLTFSAFGSAVNEVQRLEIADQEISRRRSLPATAFVDYCGGDWTELGSETLRGVKEDMKVLCARRTHRRGERREAADRDTRAHPHRRRATRSPPSRSAQDAAAAPRKKSA